MLKSLCSLKQGFGLQREPSVLLVDLRRRRLHEILGHQITKRARSVPQRAFTLGVEHQDQSFPRSIGTDVQQRFKSHSVERGFHFL